jgi:hypothetical protein
MVAGDYITPFEDVAGQSQPQSLSYETPNGLSTLSTFGAGASSAAVLRVTSSAGRAVPEDPGIVTDFQLQISRNLKGAAPTAVTLLGGTVGNVRVAVTEQPELPLGLDLFVVFQTNKFGQYPALVAPMAGANQVVINGDSIAISTAMAAITNVAVTP